MTRTTATWDARVTDSGIWLCIPSLPPSLNVWSRQHWRTRHRKVQEITQALTLLKAAKRLPKIATPEVRIVYYFRDRRRRDPDNYAPKFLLDGLRHAEIIAEDNSKVLRLPQPIFEVDSKRPRTEVLISDWSKEKAGQTA